MAPSKAKPKPKDESEGPVDGKLLRFKIEGDKRVFELDPEKLTFDEQELLSQWYPGRPLHEIFLDPVLFQIACLRLAVRRKDPELAVKLGDLSMDKLEVIERPTNAGSQSGTRD